MPVYVCNPSMCTRSSSIVFNSFFLVYAAHVVILGIAWRLWAQPSDKLAPDILNDQNMEAVAIDTAISVLDFCGQRNTFARKYSLLIKELRSQLDGGPSSAGRIWMPTSSSVSSASPYSSSQVMGMQNTSSPGSISHDESLGRACPTNHAYAIPDYFSGYESGANQPLPSVESGQRSLSTDFEGMGFDLPWLERPQDSGPAGDPLFPGTSL
jgi:hypothetical protein